MLLTHHILQAPRDEALHFSFSIPGARTRLSPDKVLSTLIRCYREGRLFFDEYQAYLYYGKQTLIIPEEALEALQDLLNIESIHAHLISSLH